MTALSISTLAQELTFERRTEMTDRERAVLDVIESYGWVDGDHHKAWVLDQIVRLLAEDYGKWVKAYKAGEDGPDTYSYYEGIAP